MRTTLRSRCAEHWDLHKKVQLFTSCASNEMLCTIYWNDSRQQTCFLVLLSEERARELVKSEIEKEAHTHTHITFNHVLSLQFTFLLLLFRDFMAYIMKNEIEISRLAAASCWLWWLRRKKEIASFSFHLALSLSCFAYLQTFSFQSSFFLFGGLVQLVAMLPQSLFTFENDGFSYVWKFMRISRENQDYFRRSWQLDKLLNS